MKAILTDGIEVFGERDVASLEGLQNLQDQADEATDRNLTWCLQGRVIDGYDYTHQAWVVDGKYVRCGHPESMNCKCYGRLHEGENINAR